MREKAVQVLSRYKIKVCRFYLDISEGVQVYKVYKRMCAGTLLTRRLSASPTSQKTKAFFIFRFLSQKTETTHSSSLEFCLRKPKQIIELFLWQ